MRQSEFSFFLNIALSYVTFGLAIYAIAGFIALMWIRRKVGTPRPLLRNFCLTYASIAGLIFLDACRQLWDSFHSDHFPMEITRMVLPALYLLMGNTLATIATSAYPAGWRSQPKEDSEQPKQAGV